MSQQVNRAIRAKSSSGAAGSASGNTSGLTIRAFCEQHHLSQPSFYAWRRAIQQRDAVTSTLVSVQLVPDDEPVAASIVEVVLPGGPTLRVAAAARCGKSAATAARAPGGLLVLSFPPAVRIWLGNQSVDMRRGFDGLAEQVRQHLQADPLSGHVFVFRNKRGDRLKLLYWDEDGFVIVYKRLERAPSAGGSWRRASRASDCERPN